MSDPSDQVEPTGYIQTEYGYIAYFSVNEGAPGTPLLILHGGPGGSSDPSYPIQMGLTCPVYMFDQLGGGFSDHVDDVSQYTLEMFVSQVHSVVEYLNLNEFDLMGSSWGGGLAVAYATSEGHGNIRRLILGSPYLNPRVWAEDNEENLSAIPEEAKIIRETESSGIIQDGYVEAKVRYSKLYVYRHGIEEEMAEYILEEPPEVQVAMTGKFEVVCTGTLKDMDLIPNLSELKMPVMFIAGDHDEVTVSRMASYQKMVKGSLLTIVPDAGHRIRHEQQEIFSAAVRMFLE